MSKSSVIRVSARAIKGISQQHDEIAAFLNEYAALLDAIAGQECEKLRKDLIKARDLAAFAFSDSVEAEHESVSFLRTWANAEEDRAIAAEKIIAAIDKAFLP